MKSSSRHKSAKMTLAVQTVPEEDQSLVGHVSPCMKSDAGLEEDQSLVGHISPRMTESVYKQTEVTPFIDNAGLEEDQSLVGHISPCMTEGVYKQTEVHAVDSQCRAGGRPKPGGAPDFWLHDK